MQTACRLDLRLIAHTGTKSEKFCEVMLRRICDICTLVIHVTLNEIHTYILHRIANIYFEVTAPRWHPKLRLESHWKSQPVLGDLNLSWQMLCNGANFSAKATMHMTVNIKDRR